MWNIEGARCVLHQVTVLRKGIITKQHAWECLIRIKQTAMKETILTELLRLDVLAIPFIHGQSDEQCVSFSETTEEKKRHHMALHGHDAQIAPYAFPGERRLADGSYIQIWTNPGRSHL